MPISLAAIPQYPWRASSGVVIVSSANALASGWVLDPQYIFDLQISEVAMGVVALSWRWPTIALVPDSYNVQLNGVVQATVSGNPSGGSGYSTTIAGLLVNTDYTLVVSASLGGVNKGQSQTRIYRYGSNEVTTVTYMPRIKPFPSTGYN